MLRLLFACALLSACTQEVPIQMITPRPTTTPMPAQPVTINGYDAVSKTTIDPINLWRDYADRSKGIAGQVHHGERVTFVRQEGAGVLIRTATGVEGWLNIAFIRR